MGNRIHKCLRRKGDICLLSFFFSCAKELCCFFNNAACRFRFVLPSSEIMNIEFFFFVSLLLERDDVY